VCKYSSETKIAACKEYIEGIYPHREIYERYGIYFNTCDSTIIGYLAINNKVNPHLGLNQ